MKKSVLDHNKKIKRIRNAKFQPLAFILSKPVPASLVNYKKHNHMCRNIKCDNNRTANKILATMNPSPLETVWMIKQSKN